ncbi:MAG: Xaa-Pro peptidase family protein [Oscillospiraceae bacterium]|nr:Xaa-Pro peptidase family protein [Oscillospiraceae bacterium]
MNRIRDMQAALPTRNLDGLLLTGPINRRWAIGFPSSAGALVVTERESVFITDSRYIEAAKTIDRSLSVVEIKTGQSYAALINEVLGRNNVKRLGFEENVMTQGTYTVYQEKLDVELIPAQTLLDDLRAMKTPEEYALMRASQAITDKTFAEILPLITKDLTERSLAAEIIYRLLKNGAERPAFDPIVVSGSRSSMPHGTPSDQKLEGFITLDFGAVYQGYTSDMTRTLCLGTPNEEMRTVYETVLQAQRAGIAAAKAGIIGKDLDRVARDVIEAAGYGDYFNHSFGHSLGLEVHESLKVGPTEEKPLPKCAVISAEPGIYLPGKFGVRIEDTLYLTETGCEILTQTPKKLIVL